MANLVIIFADSEIKVRLQVLFCEYADTTIKIVEGFVKVEKQTLSAPLQKLSEKDFFHTAIHDALNKIPDKHWELNPYIASAEEKVLQS